MNEKLASAVTTLVVPATILVALLVDRNGISVRMGLLLLAGLVVTGGAAFFGRREVDSPAQALLQTGVPRTRRRMCSGLGPDEPSWLLGLPLCP